MLNRRHIRIKVLQVLYAFFHSQSDDIINFERELKKSLEQSYSLYLHLLLLLVDLKIIAVEKIEKGKRKLLPTDQDIKPSFKFAENKILNLLNSNHFLIDKSKNYTIFWNDFPEIKNKLFRQIQESDLYEVYMNSNIKSFSQDQKFICDLFREFIAPNIDLHRFLEEKSIYWNDDYSIVNLGVFKTLKSFKETSDSYTRLLNLYKDMRDEKYALDLLNITISNSSYYNKLIVEVAKNWDEDRISDMDLILLKMAICELLNFNNIPVKVSINEYIELSKEYSSEKSCIFVNGIIDKLAVKFKNQGKLKKYGRGLVE